MSANGDWQRTLKRWVKLAEAAGWTVERRSFGGQYTFRPPDGAGISVPAGVPGQGKHAHSGSVVQVYRSRLRRAGLREA